MSYKVLSKLNQISKEYFTVNDLIKLLKIKKENIYVTLHRLVRSGVLIRLKKGIYQKNYSGGINIEKIANQLYYPSYISLEYALARYGIISQIPHTITFVTLRKTKKITLGSQMIEYHRLNKKLYFGYKLVDGVYIAEPEKALLDLLHIISYGKETLKEELKVGKVDIKKVLLMSKKFSDRTKKLLRKVLNLNFCNFLKLRRYNHENTKIKKARK